MVNYQLTLRDLQLLHCPRCFEKLQHYGKSTDNALQNGALICSQCKDCWPFQGHFACLFHDEDIKGSDRVMQSLYNRFASWHDLAVKYWLPTIQFAKESTLRERYIKKFEFDKTQKKKLKILETGVGTGSNIEWIRKAIPPEIQLEYWGLDISRSMVQTGIKHIKDFPNTRIRLLLADAHQLPFKDHTFDRVFHVGGINGFRNPSRALEEMCRVAAPNSPIVVVDEQFANKKNLYQKLMFSLVTFYDSTSVAPVKLLPKEVKEVSVDQITDFYYCLSFKVPNRKQKPVRKSKSRSANLQIGL